MLDVEAKHHLVEDFTTTHTNHPFVPVSPSHVGGVTRYRTHESSSSGSWRFWRGETSLRWGSWLKDGLGTGLVFLVFWNQNENLYYRMRHSRCRGSCALRTLLSRRAVGRGSRGHEGRRKGPATRGELPLEVEGA